MTRIEWDGTMRRRMVDTARRGDGPQWEDLAARALTIVPPYRPVPRLPVYHVRVDQIVVQAAEHDLTAALLDLMTAVPALGEELSARPASRDATIPTGSRSSSMRPGRPWQVPAHSRRGRNRCPGRAVSEGMGSRSPWPGRLHAAVAVCVVSGPGCLAACAVPAARRRGLQIGNRWTLENGAAPRFG